MTEKRKKPNIGANKGKMGKPPADWVLNLKNGKYTTKQLIEITNKDSKLISFAMRKYAKNIEYEVSDKGRAIAIYEWNHDHFLKIYYASQ